MTLWLDLGEYRGPSRFHAFVMYCAGRYAQRHVELSYRTYVTDSLQGAASGKYVSQRWVDLIAVHEDFDADATIDHVFERLGWEKP